MAVSSSSRPLCEKVSRKSLVLRAVDLTILSLLFALLLRRLLYINQHGIAWIVAFLCESCFCFIWLLVTSIKWSPMEYKPYPSRLDERVHELPPVDMFVTTADPVLEPPIITVNTVLSLLAVNYPANKLACYVSDDGCSPLNYFSLIEASKFAKIWVPFCKNYNVQVRAPFRYFLNPPAESEGSCSIQFMEKWQNMKVEYEKLTTKLEKATTNSYPLDLMDDFAVFSNVERQNHSTIVKVIHENKEGVGEDGEVPHIVYMAREKRPQHPHHYKAGAMNSLVQVSGLVTNAPYMLNVDCDMYVNNPDIIRQAMCMFLGSEKQNENAFIQSPQMFYNNFGDELVVLQTYLVYGIVGIQGPLYIGSGCFHIRKIIYSLSPNDLEDDGNLSAEAKGKLLAEGDLLRKFGNSKEMVESAAEALQGKSNLQNALADCIEAAHKVADCNYEYFTGWGKKIGWLYGSTVEDFITSCDIHSRGWRSLYNSPEPPAFLGCMPTGGPAALGQQRRWATGLLEALFKKQSPVVGTLRRKLRLRQGLAYLYFVIWGLRSLPELCYSLLPTYCILSNSLFLFKGVDFYIMIVLIVIHSLYTMWEYVNIGLPIQSWFASQLSGRIKATCSWLFSIPDITSKFLGLSETIFIITKKTISSTSTKDDEDTEEGSGKLVFDDSIYFLPGTMILLVNMVTLAYFLLGLLRPPLRLAHDGGSGLGEALCCMVVVMLYWPFLRGFFEKGKYGIPLSTILKATMLASLFVHVSTRSGGSLMSS